MAPANPQSTATDTTRALQLTRRFAAPRAAVYDAFTKADIFMQWWGPKSMTCPAAEIDARPGGRFHAEMLTPEGNTHMIEGVFQEAVRPSRLVFTWVWGQGDYKDLETLVTLEFMDDDGATEMRLTHERLADEAARDLHGKGWSSSFDCLEDTLAARTRDG